MENADGERKFKIYLSINIEEIIMIITSNSEYDILGISQPDHEDLSRFLLQLVPWPGF